LDRDDRDRQRCGELEHEGGQERDAQHTHRGATVVVGDGGDRALLSVGTAEDPQRGEAVDEVEEVPGEPLECLPLPAGPRLRRQADEHHEDRQQRQRERHDQARRPVGQPDADHDQRGDDAAHHQLRQVAGEVRVESVDSAGGELGQLGAAPLPQPARPQLGDPTQQRGAQLGLHGCGRPGRDELLRPGEDRAPDDNAGQQDEIATDLGGAGTAEEDRGDGVRDHVGLDDDAAGTEHPEDHCELDERPRGPAMAQQARVEGSHPVTSRAAPRRRAARWSGCSPARSACGTPSSSNPRRTGSTAT
jgi:hypothetical protein